MPPSPQLFQNGGLSVLPSIRETEKSRQGPKSGEFGVWGTCIHQIQVPLLFKPSKICNSENKFWPLSEATASNQSIIFSFILLLSKGRNGEVRETFNETMFSPRPLQSVSYSFHHHFYLLHFLTLP
jgi:hypothetical protein